MQLLEVTPAFNRGGTRCYIDGKRVTQHDFCKALYAARGASLGGTTAEIIGRMNPDHRQHTTNRNGDTMTRDYWNL